ncbi:hypothetical protein AGMMS49944_14520 [Spirochaetia bacterium]|nr:hypothetical protein AGMMS49944_14520 [Spirochaetia bacterium]
MRKRMILTAMFSVALALGMVFIGCGDKGSGDSTSPPDTRMELTAGGAVNAAYTATTADVTFTGATGLSLAAADFTVTTGGTIGIPAVSGGTVTVPVTFAVNTGTLPKTYTVGINSGSTKIKGSATVVITQAAAPVLDTRTELAAGGAVNAAYSDTTADVTFTGATGLSLAAADFTVTTGGSIGTPAVSGDTVTVPITFAANNDTSPKTYTVGISSGSTKIKGNATVVITQAELTTGTAQVIYTWVNEHEIVTSATTATLSRAANQSLTITVTGSGYSNYQWSLKDGDVAGAAGTAASYTFSSAGHGNGKYTIGLRLKKDDAWYSTQITITVQD